MNRIARRTVYAGVVAALAATLSGGAPANATGVAIQLHIEICGDTGSSFVACITGNAVNANTWTLHVGGTRCPSTCQSYTADTFSIPVASVSFSRTSFAIPYDAFDACATLLDGGTQRARDCA